MQIDSTTYGIRQYSTLSALLLKTDIFLFMFTCKLRISGVCRVNIKCESKERSMYVNNTLSEAEGV